MAEQLTSQSAGGGSIPTPSLQFPEIAFEFCTQTDPRFVAMRRVHYVPIKGTHGQQIHFLIWRRQSTGWLLAGAISGASAVWATPARDRFFGITTANRKKLLNGIIDNVFFRLQLAEPNLATQILSSWRKVVRFVWNELYGVQVFGFETLIGDLRDPQRVGTIYKADNWVFAGKTEGNTKSHGKGGLTGGLTGTPYVRHRTDIKFVFCKLDGPVIEQSYQSSWRANTPGGTAEEKQRARQVSQKRQRYLGPVWLYSQGKHVKFMEAQNVRS